MKQADILKDKEVLIFVFPVWWFSMLAMLKGYIDCVFNLGLFYGQDVKWPFDSVRWIALVGGDQKSFEEYGNDKHMASLLNDKIIYYCGG